MKTSLKNFTSTFIAIVIFFVAFSSVKYGVSENNKNNKNKKNSIVQNQIGETLDEIEKRIENDNSDKTYSEKAITASQETLRNELSKNKNSEVTAAGAMIGYYTRVTEATPKYCETLGTDVSPFVNRFKVMHKTEYNNAVEILKHNNQSIEDLKNSIRNTAYDYVKKEVHDIQTMTINATGEQTFTLAMSCSVYNMMAEDPTGMESSKFSNLSPDAYEIIMKQ